MKMESSFIEVVVVDVGDETMASGEHSNDSIDEYPLLLTLSKTISHISAFTNRQTGLQLAGSPHSAIVLSGEDYHAIVANRTNIVQRNPG